MMLMLIVALPFAGSICAGLMRSNARNAEAWLAGAIALTCAILVLVLFSQVTGGGVVRSVLPWSRALNLDFSLRMDGYAWLMAFIICAMGALVVLYARYYMSPEDPVPRFFSFLLAFMGAMLGVVLSGNLIQMVLFWELTSLSSFMLIAYWHHRADARRGAQMALTITAGGGLCLLAGVLMLGHIVGSYELDRVLASGDLVRAHPWYPVLMVLIALGALTKSAQFPFQFWLPNAMAAPTPVSAYLHSATMVKLGVLLLARLWPVLAGTDEWFWIIGGAGLCSLVIGAYAAIFQRDMKGVLAYSTISHLGLICLLLGLNSKLALVAAIFHMVNHATFKASLFMAAGIVDHETGTRDVTRLSGLFRAMPITAALAIVAAASMAGVPLLNGFISKEMFFTETVYIAGHPAIQWGLPMAATVAGAFSVAYSLRFIAQVFFGPPPAQDLPRAPHEPVLWMLLPSALLVCICLVVGIFPSYTLGPLLYVAAEAILGAGMPSYSLAIWHGFTLPLAMSFLALAGGILIYLALRRHQRVYPGRTPVIYRLDGRRSFEFVLDGALVVAGWLISRLTSHRLQIQVLVLMIVVLFASVLPLWSGAWWGSAANVQPLDPVFATLWIIGAACAVGAANQAKYHRLAALMLAGGAGLVTCLTFVWFSAPDLALTQLAVEVVTAVLILLGLRWLPRRVEGEDDEVVDGRLRVKARRARDMLLAIACGAGLAAIAYAVLTRPAIDGISPFFVRHALSEGGGANVVNVLLVDFRGFDTLGEITVLAIVALTVFALLRRFRPAPESIELPQQQRSQATDDAHPLIEGDATSVPPEQFVPQGPMMVPAVLVRLLLPVAGLISVFFLLRGHDQPGGGFVGGLVMATAVILQYVVGGVVWVESRGRIHPQYWIAAGLICAGVAALSSWFAARPLLTALTGDIHLPVIGAVHLSTVLLFDMGVYMLVIGATVLILVALAHQSLRVSRRHAADLARAVQSEAS
jgi:multicomponent K+:H+ antiporter subunit A